MSQPNPARSADAFHSALPAPDDQAAEPAVVLDGSWRANLAWLRERLRARFSSDLADDLAQETYLRLVGRGPSAPTESARGLLMTVATNLARDTFRRERVRTAFAARTAGDDAVPGGHTVADDLEVREAILRLPPHLREVLLLSKIGGLTNREIAQRYGLSVRAIDKRLQKALTLFVAHLRD